MLSAMVIVPLTTSCVYDNLPAEEENNQHPDINGDSIQLKISLLSMGSRDDNDDFEKYEDAINTSELRLMFFNNETNVLIKQFLGTELEFIPINSSENGLKNWYVRIPIDDEDFVVAIRENDFKIAVLANWTWPNDVTLVEGEDTLDKLHHLVSDDEYNKYSEVYGFLMDNGKIGQYTDWVISRKVKSITAAEAWIKENWDPSKNNNYGTYQDLRLLWNFNAALTGKMELPGGLSNTFGEGLEEKWIAKNQNELFDWLSTSKEDSTLPDPSDQGNGIQLGSRADEEVTYLASLDPLQADNGEFEFVGATGAYVTEKDGIKGVVLPQGDYNQDAFRFKFVSTGYVRVVWGSADGSEAKLKLQRRTFKDSQAETEEKNPNGSSEAENTYKWNISITGDSEYLTIYSQKGNAIIYEIEFVADKYLYDTDRTGLTPKDQLIPMYGIQKYDKLGDVWVKGTTFDLSNFNHLGPSDYHYADISLLRSVAKVELLIPHKLQANHVFLRSQNRMARCEPVDLYSSTGEVWENVGNNESNEDDETEWSKVRFRNPFLNSSDSYYNDLNWYYSNYDKFKSTNFPQIINPKINRSDFTEFIQANQTKDIDRYVLYVPEKFVDDPNDVGDNTSRPKVCHIEFRLYGDPVSNLDDDNCYRIYFIENGVVADENFEYPDFKKPEGEDKYNTWENTYENQVDYLQQHWPIIRNHVYTFEVEGNGGKIAVKLKVLPWKRKDIGIEW